jgi:hypothetical protein
MARISGSIPILPCFEKNGRPEIDGDKSVSAPNGASRPIYGLDGGSFHAGKKLCEWDFDSGLSKPVQGDDDSELPLMVDAGNKIYAGSPADQHSFYDPRNMHSRTFISGPMNRRAAVKRRAAGVI